MVIMKKKIFSICVLLLCIHYIFSQNKELKFNASGEFKIVQFTDLHIEMKKSDADSESVFNAVKELIVLEKPDLVVITGDIITQDPAGYVMKKLAAVFEEQKTLWAIVLGNHDDECSHIERVRLAEMYRSMPYTMNIITGGIKGATNYILPITGTGNKTQALLYLLDSHGYNPMKGKVNSYYAWFDFSQISWYREQSAMYTQKNNGTPLPALAFFHIPFPEYSDLWVKDSARCIGIKKEPVASPKINSGMYTAMLECGDVMGTFVGHDHDNDYIGNFNGIALAYGRCTRGKNPYVYASLPQGGRVIVLKEGKREFDTWIREVDSKMVNKCTYPQSFSSTGTAK